MEITLRYFDGCPNWRIAERLLRTALSEAGAAHAVFCLQQVATHEDAQRLGFCGSPTILIDGRDPFVDHSAGVGLSCRVYATPEGLRGAPTVDQLRAALGA